MRLFDSLLGVVVKTSMLPVTIAADVATAGGALTDKEGTYTGDMIKGIEDSLKKVSDD